MDHLDIAPVARMTGAVQLPGSKSISNRTLLLAALAHGSTELVGLLEADDVDIMLAALRTLGVRIERLAGAGEFVVRGTGGGFVVKRARLFLGNAGTALRPLTAALALCGGEYELSGVARMHQRPVGDLVAALRTLGADIRYLGEEGFPPLAIGQGRVQFGERVTIRGAVSSQFVTALLMALPLGVRAITVDIAGELVSRPYVEMTCALMARFGIAVEFEGSRLRLPAAGGYRSPGRIMVEGDASSASYFLAAGAIGGGPVRVQGVGTQSIQGDVGFADTLAAMGAQVTRGADWIEAQGRPPLHPIDADFSRMPDAAMTAAMAALFAPGTSTLRNIGTWRVKETDRIAAMATELGKLGAKVDAGADWMSITPPARLKPATIDTYDDHRMAMCFALAALGGVAVRINDPDCVRKTFPDYFAVLGALAR